MNLKNFGETLKELLNERNMTAKDFAKIIGVSAPTITRYIRGERMPNINILILIADALNRSVDFLLGREPENANLKFKKCPPFSDQIVILANAFGKNNSDFYKTIDISESTFYEWKNGSSLPTLESIENIAIKIDRRFDFVLGRES